MLVCTTALVWMDIREMASTVEVKELFAAITQIHPFVRLFVCSFVCLLVCFPVLTSHNYHPP